MKPILFAAAVMRRINLLVVVCAMIFLGPQARSTQLFEVARFTSTENLYSSSEVNAFEQNPFPEGFYSDGLVKAPLIGNYARAVDFPLVTTTVLQSVEITDVEPLPSENGPLVPFVVDGVTVDEFDANNYIEYEYSGPDPAGTVLYTNPATPPPCDSCNPPPPTCGASSLASSGLSLASSGASSDSCGPPASYLYVDITTSYDPSDPTTSPTKITAVATIAPSPPSPDSWFVGLPKQLPPGMTTLDQVASFLGYSSLQWSQQVTIPAPSPAFACTDIDCTDFKNITGQSFDAPEFGWTYCNPKSLGLKGVSVLSGGVLPDPALYGGGDCRFYYPFYPSSASPTSLTYSDNPTDPCLFGGSGLGCNGMTETSVNALPLAFMTELVGVPLSDPSHPVGLFPFTWIDTFNGTSGGIPKLANLSDVDPGSGTGGVTLLSVNGVDVDVPEPSTFVLLGAALFGLRASRRRH